MRRVLVTGASSGIGLACARAFLREGETVHVVLGERADEVVPIVLAAPGGIGGFTLSDELPRSAAAKIVAAGRASD